MNNLLIIKGPKINPESIQAKVHPEIANTSCWFSKSKVNNKLRPHQFIYEKYFGKIPINEKTNKRMCVCHKCDHGPYSGMCVNPLHLFLGTDKDNSYDQKIKGRALCPQERKDKISKSHFGIKNSEETRCKISIAFSIRKIKKLLFKELSHACT